MSTDNNKQDKNTPLSRHYAAKNAAVIEIIEKSGAQKPSLSNNEHNDLWPYEVPENSPKP